ncbi:hypothetical protein [Myxococcus fulvus]|uniref:hypothetical protein n=1 Tax=Myxococcus fulvus TaxID=33 RepID=UPI0020BE12C9|nr:hypothetical protein [Myxococcus fulvus]MCK8501585.1 hypothetical protein [Myxococcus fulvus]
MCSPKPRLFLFAQRGFDEALSQRQLRRRAPLLASHHLSRRLGRLVSVQRRHPLEPRHLVGDIRAVRIQSACMAQQLERPRCVPRALEERRGLEQQLHRTRRVTAQLGGLRGADQLARVLGHTDRA